MGLLFSDEIRKQIANEVQQTVTHLHIVSAYCKVDAIRFIEETIKLKTLCKKLMVRFSFNDIVSGASDLAVYEYCKEHGWAMYVRFDLHAKTYIFDKVRGIIGSANLTSKGIGLANNSNYEIAELTTISSEEMQKVETLFENSIRMNDSIYERMCKCISERIIDDAQPSGNWNQDILRLFNPKVDVLFTYEFPNCSSLGNLKEDSLEFLGLTSGWDINIIKSAFMMSNVYIWLKNKLKAMPNKEIYFGELSAALHEIIINDPKPYRKEVKDLLGNLLSWITELNIDDILIDRPRYSQRIRYVE